MEWTGLNELREKFLKFFESKGHTILPSFPLVPQDDKSILLINAGMTPLKKYFSGQETPPNTRITTCQKCIRTPDIENVGKTARHGTYFEMLGNFSFGDYFKKEATLWAWEFCTQVLKMPADKLWISVYEEDEEARQIWINEVGVDPAHIVKMGKEDNFWEHGSGPCGPCSEIYFDRGPENGCGSPDCKVGCECDRYVEFWNVVFSQFNNDGNGNYTPLAQKNIDTGMGLERLACIMQGVDNIFLVDTIHKIVDHVAKITGVPYGQDPQKDISIRVITDHIRSTVFMIGDGVLPQNEGRGYVLRRLLRRAARHGMLLGIKEPFLYKLCNTVIEENRSAYPMLEEKRNYIQKVIKTEEENFSRTIQQGMDMLNGIIDKIEAADMKTEKILPGEDAFRLYDTFGFPIDLTKEIIAERNIIVDENRFHLLMAEQKQRAKANRGSTEAFGGDTSAFDSMLPEKTQFIGYNSLSCETNIALLMKDGDSIETANEGDIIQFALPCTPFYAESGGQVADKGLVKTENAEIAVLDVKKSASGNFIHTGKVRRGKVSVGETVEAEVCAQSRNATMRNHTAAHLLQAALINVLGEHVHQAGQLVDDKRLRFDFNHFSAVNQTQLQTIEDMVNQQILQAIDVRVFEAPIEEAKKLGAMALFGEKYGEVVRVVDVKDCSIELCGGTHVSNTGQIGLLKIVSESSVAAGVRRIEAVTGLNVLHMLEQTNAVLNEIAASLKLGNAGEILHKISSTQNELKEKDREIDRLNQEMAEIKFAGMFDIAEEINGVKFAAITFNGMKADGLRKIGDTVKQRRPGAIAIISTMAEDKATVLCVCGKEAVEKGAHAGKIVKRITEIAGGGGGGKPDSAMAGVKDPFKLDEAIAALPEFLQGMIE